MSGIHEAMSAVMEDVRSLRKDGRNTQGGYAFRGVDAVMNAVGPALRRHGVIVTPLVERYEHGEILVGSKRTPMGHAKVIVVYTFHASDDSTIMCSAAGEAFDSGDKATAKAMSVAFRTALLQALCLPTDEPDPDHSTYERAESSRDIILQHHEGDFGAAVTAAAAAGFHNLRDRHDLDGYAAHIRSQE